jgi:hypothetical protein
MSHGDGEAEQFDYPKLFSHLILLGVASQWRKVLSDPPPMQKYDHGFVKSDQVFEKCPLKAIPEKHYDRCSDQAAGQ